ncbi:unnamed protein product [Rotaria magnacalcarata]|uniref:NAD(P)(+)--arginine ADP-ribosyltransferase n=1 Tax=Rotaria magnacalcarata TaxID=392030 RepID=A0A814UH33_9BILA|nr:unnamed protein product [Rotaria magnacalcarata]CAF1416078.1 unnamed protein product [Rotaria magnacalcarata]CAF4088538.1 unnamed protein product [Rotaria magnacalcarata]
MTDVRAQLAMHQTTAENADVTSEHKFCVNINQSTENIQLLWCDACCADDNSMTTITTDYDVQSMKEMFSALSPLARYFGDTDVCIEYIKSTDNNASIILVVSGSYASTVLSSIHNCRSVSFIFIFCESYEKYASLLTLYNKIINIYTEQEPLRSAITKKIDLLEKQILQFVVFNQRQKSIRDLTEKTFESFVFVLHSILLSILRQMIPDEHAKVHLISTCEHYYCNSKHDLKMIEHFRTTFKPEDAIKWYTNNCFLFRLLNKALRTEDVDLLFAFRYYINILCNALESEERKFSSNTTLTVYRGQKILKTEFELLRQRIGSFIATNGFVSTSLDADVALMFTGYGSPCPESLCIVLFEIQVDPSVESVIFALIEGESNFIDEKEVLFSLNAVFTIKSIDFDDKYQVWKVVMSPSDDGARYVNRFLEAAATAEDWKFYTPLTFYGHVLWYEFYQVDKGEAYFRRLVETLPSSHSDLPTVYYELGSIFHKKKDWSQALQNLIVAQDLLYTLNKGEAEMMALIWHAIGEAYKDKGDLNASLDYLQRALHVWKSDYEYVRKAHTIECIGQVYELISAIDHQNIISEYYSKALGVYQRILPFGNEKIINCLERIGHFYDVIGQFDRGLDHYKQASSSILMSTCQDASTFFIGLDHLMRNLKTRITNFGSESTLDPAFLLLNEIFTTRIHSIGEDENHPNIAFIIASMGDLCEKTQLLAKSVYYELALCKLELNCERNLLTIVFEYVKKLYIMYEQVQDYDNALKCLQRKLAIEKKYYEENHMDIIGTLFQIARIHIIMKSHPSVILEYVTKALTLYDSCERPEETQDIQFNLVQMLFFESRRLNNSLSTDENSARQ